MGHSAQIKGLHKNDGGFQLQIENLWILDTN